jgi:phosphoribosylglycinamide formyltransferase-1
VCGANHAVIKRRKREGYHYSFVDELYDHGKHILQVTCPVLPGDTPEMLAKRIHQTRI